MRTSRDILLAPHLAPRTRAVLHGMGRDLSQATRALLDVRLWLLLGIYLVLLLAAAQQPLDYRFQVGQETGRLSDQPFLDGFYPGEGSGAERLRWGRGEALMVVPGVGQRGLIVRLPVASHRAQIDPTQPLTQLTLQPANGKPLTIALRRERATYQIYLPPRDLAGGALRLGLATEPWSAPGDSRVLGVALAERIGVTSVRSAGFAWPDTNLVRGGAWGLLLLWVALGLLGFARRTVFALLLPLAVGAALLQLIDPPRLAFGGSWAVQMGLLGLGTAVVSVWTLPPLLRRLRAAPPPLLLPWLLLLVGGTLVLKYGGRLYPDAMPGDIQFHVNHYMTTVSGEIYALSRHRNLPFPYPPALYLLLAPLELLGLNMRAVLQFSAGLFEAGTVLLLYLLARRISGNALLALLTAGIYALVAAGFMVTWFAFATQVSTQFVVTLLLTVLLLRWPRYDTPLSWLIVLLLFCQVFLGHTGQFINVGLVGLLAVPLLYWNAPNAAVRRGVVALGGAGFAAALLALALYYSAFADLIWSHLSTAARGGINDITGKQPIPRVTTLRVLWEGGLITHLGFFPAPLALVGALLWYQRRPRPPLLVLISGTFAVSAALALLPLLTLSSITTRWLMFATWAIALCGALTLLHLWRRGVAARLTALAMGGYVAWVTLIVFLEALALRKPPIEPF